MLFTISEVSAVDSSTDAVGAANTTVEVKSVDNDDSLGMQNDVESLGEGETDDGTFAALDTKISNASAGDTVHLLNDYVYSSTDTLDDGVYITKNLVIDGEGHAIDAKGNINIINIYGDDVQVTLKNIIFKNGKSDYGGAIYWSSLKQCNIINCTFINNTDTGYFGGAICIYNGIASIKQSTFINNTASGSNGGAISIRNGPMGINGCIFINNSATGQGSAIYSLTSNNVNIRNSVFLNNSGDKVIYSKKENTNVYNNWFGNTIDNKDETPDVSSELTLNNWNILNLELNHDSQKAIISLNQLYVDGVLDTANPYELPSLNFNVKGNGIELDTNVDLNSDGNATVGYDSSNKYSITVSYNGVELTKSYMPSFKALNDKLNGEGNIFILDQDYEFDLTKDSDYIDGIEITKFITIDGQGHFIDAKGQARIFKVDGLNTLTLKNIIFKNGFSSANGGAVLADVVKIEIINCTFDSNKAQGEGDAIYIMDITGTENILDKSTFINNKGTASAIYVYSDNGQLMVSNSIMLNSTGLNIKSIGDVLAQFNWFGHNSTNYQDSSLTKVSGDVSVTNWLFLKVTTSGSAGDVMGDATVSLNNLYGGAVSIYDNYALPKITLDFSKDNLDTSKTKFIIKETGYDALTYEMKSNISYLNISCYKVVDVNKIIYGDDGSFTSLQNLIKFTPENGELTLNNDYVYNMNKDSTYISGVEFTVSISINGNGHKIDGNNQARITYVDIEGITFKNITFVNGNRANGGVIYNYYPGIVNFVNCTFINNSATRGGVSYNEYATTNFDDCSFINNTAGNGAVAYDYGYYSGTYKNSLFNGNKGSNSIIYINTNVGSKLIDSCIFINNTATTSIIYANSETIKNSIFLNNTAQKIFDSMYTAESINADYNWFGNNATNYDQKPNIPSDLTLTKWYYLDVDTTIKGHAIVSLKLTDGTQDIDNEPDLPDINLTIENENLTVAKEVTLKSGKADVPYTFTSKNETGSITVKQTTAKMTNEMQMGDFDILQRLIDEKDVIQLTRDYTYGILDTITEGIVIDRRVTINGNGHVIDAKGKSRIFDINGNEVVINNVSLINGKSDDEGAAIIWRSPDGILKSSIIINNTGNSAIYWEGACGDINNCVLLNNSGKNIISTETDLKADYNWFGNNASNYNQAIANCEGVNLNNWYFLDINLHSSYAHINLNNVFVSVDENESNENYALPNVNLTLTGENITVQSSVIISHSGNVDVSISPDYKGISFTAVYKTASYTKNTTLEGDFDALQELINNAKANNIKLIELDRDYVYVIGADTIEDGITIDSNDLTINGNGHKIDAKEQTRIFNVGEADRLFASNVTIKNTTFVNGKISNAGGAIRWNGWNGTLINCTFENNSATNNGGAVYWYGQNATVTNCTFKNNIVTGSNRGGAIHLQSKGAKVFNSTFSENKAGNGGGAICIFSDNIVVNKSTFVKNTDSPSGSAIYVASNNATIINSTFIDNSAGDGGAINWYSGDKGTIIGSKFINNYANGNGGALNWNIKLNVINSTFENNKAKTSGGAIYCANIGGTIFNSTFINNTAQNGGVIYLYSGSLDINETDFIDNTATATGSAKPYGGVIYDMQGVNLNIHNSNFTHNGVTSVSGYAYAGVIYLKNAKVNITNSTFDRNYIKSNSGTTYGTVFYWSSTAKGEITNSSFLNNHGKSSTSAAMYGTGSGVKVNITNSIFLNNTYGDSNTLKVVHSYNSAAFNFTDCWFGNTKENSGESMGTTIGDTITYNNKLTLYTVHDEFMVVGEDKEIKFVFRYVENGNPIIYDSSKLPKVNLTLSSVNGDLDKDSASMDETIWFNADHFGAASITAKYNGIELTEDLYAKDKPTITVDPIIVHVDESVQVNVVELIPSDAELKFSSVEGDEFIVVSYNGYVEGLKEGTSTVYIKYDGNENYSPATVEVPVTVIKYTTSISTNLTESEPVDSITVDWGADSQNIIIGFDNGNPDYNPDYPSAYDKFTIKYKSNDTNVATVSVEGKAYINFRSAGTANITFNFEENEKYYGSEKNITVTVKKVPSSVEFSDDIEFDYLSSGTTTLTLDGCTVGDANIIVVDHSEATISYENNVITVSSLDAGTYTLKVTTTPDENHTSVDKTAGITVKKIDSSVSFSNDVEFDYLGSGTTTLTLVGCSVDLVNIFVVGHEEATIEYNPDTKVVTVSHLDAGTYTLKVTTTPDSNHESVDGTADITVNKIDSSVGFSGDIEFNYLESGTTTLVDYDGCSVDLVNITVDGHPEADIGFENNVVTVSGLGAGTYTLKVTTTPDSNHESVEATKGITVNKIASSITLSSTDIVYKYDESNTTTLTLVGCSVDLVNITVDGNNVAGITYDAETKVITISGLDVGTYTLKVTTTPDENHTSVDATASITVEKSNSSVIFSNPVELFFSESGTTTLTLNGCSVDLENIIVVDHPEAIISYENNVVTVSNLTIGTYTLRVITTQDSNHLSVVNTTSVNVYKESPKLSMEYSNITFGEKEFVYVSMNTTGQVNITIFKDGSVIKTENVTIGTSKFNKTAFTGLKVGTYTISAYYEGQGRYNSSTLTYGLVIRPIYEYEFSASVNDTVMDNKTNVTVNLPEDATGKIVIGDIESPVTGAKTVIELPEQNKLGKNNVTVKYVPDEDSKYSAREMTALYEISKVDTSISINIVNKTTADPVTITATITAEGNVTFIVNGKKYSKEIISNVATLELTYVAGGEYNVTAIYGGNEKYNNSTANDTYTVEKINSTISIEVNPSTIKTNESATVTVEVQGSGIVTITVNGVKTNVTVDRGVATLPIEKLAKGTTIISAKYLGDDKYNTNETEEITLTVNPIAVEGFDIDIVDITVGDDAIAYVIIPSDATNMTNVTVKQVDNVLFSENTTFKATIPNLAVGTYNITAYYYGDDKYDVAEITKEFTVNPLNIGKLNFTATVNNTFVGEKTNVTVKISEDATGKIVIGSIESVISESEFVIELSAQTTAGLNNITVQYVPDENSKYGHENITAFYNVAKKSAEIVIADIVDIKAGDDVEIDASAYPGAVITVYVDGVKTTKVENISSGKHTVIATVEETNGYLASSTNKTFEVTKSDVGTVALVVSDGSVYVGEKLTINVNIVNVNDDVTGIVEINVNGTKYSLNISETKSLDVVMDKVGKVTLSGRYLGDYKYDAKDASVIHKTIEVTEKATPEIIIEVDQVSVVGQAITINVTDLENLTVTINGEEQSVNAGKISFTPAKDGAYTIIAKTTENKTHYAGESIASFTVINKTKQTPEITVSEINDAKVGSEITFTVDASVSEGVIVKINDEIVPLKEGTYTYTPKTSGSHILYVETEEDGQYSKGIKTQTFNVDKNDATIKVSADPVKVGEMATIEVEVTPGATGLVIINVNGTEYSIKLPQTTLEIVLDKVGSYSISASYLGDNNFTENVSDVVSLDVSQKDISNFTIEIPDDIKVAEHVTINVTCESGADLEVFIDGAKQTIKDGKVTVDTLSAGTHTIEVTSPVTSTHMANSTTQTFMVSKKQAQIQIDVEGDLVVDKNIKLNIESYPGAKITVYLDGNVLEDWENSFKTTAGDHLVIASVADSEEYLGASTNTTFTIAKKESKVGVSGGHSIVGEKLIIEVDLNKDATGIVIVNVNGTEYSLNVSKNKSLSIVLDKAGLYNISAKYLGDDKYLPRESEVNTIFAEDKKASVIDIDYPEVIYAGDNINITITSGSDALEVYLDSEKQTLKDGILAIENISSGSHVLDVVSLETSQFKYNSTSAVLNAAKKQAEITIDDIASVKAGDNVTIVVTTDSDSGVVIYVDGKRLESNTIENIAAGSHTIIASVEETDLYLKATANRTFTVDKLPASIEVNASNITQGQATEITVTTDVDEGVVVVKLNETEVAIDLAKGKSTTVVLDTPGIYEVRANYLGNDKYESAAAASFIIEVFEKATPEVNVTIPEIKAGEDGKVNISIPNATGEVHVIIDGVDNILPLNENGTADFTIPEMGAGNHSVVIVYPGDDTHEAKVVTQTVNVEKQMAEANITSPSDVKEGESATVKVEIENATGEVVIIVDGVEEKVPLVNGTIDYPLDNLSAGNHSVVVIYPGDDTHSSTYSSSSFNVEAEPVVVKLATELTNITITDDLNITAYLVDENGKPVANAEIIYRIGDETKYINTAEDGSFTINGVAKSKVTIDYAGNETLLATNTSITLQNVVTPPKLGSYFNVSEGTTFETYAVETAAGEKGALYAFTLRDSNGDPIVNATVTFAYKTVVFNSTTDENGTLYLGISTYLAQDALCAMSYVGDEKHNATFVAFNFKIMKKPTVVKAYKAKYKVKTTVKKYTVTLKTYKLSSRDGKVYLKAGKVLKIKVNGRNFYATTNSKGQATFKITNLNKKGVYIAKVIYAGSDTYAGSMKKVKITVY